MAKQVTGRAIVPGRAEGVAVVSREPLSFWGGYSPTTGEIIDRRHEKSGVFMPGKVFVFPKGKGSSTGSAVLLEAIRNGVAPAAIVTLKVDPILALGAMLADEMYHIAVPVLVVSEDDFAQIHEGNHLEIHADGTLDVV